MRKRNGRRPFFQKKKKSKQEYLSPFYPESTPYHFHYEKLTFTSHICDEQRAYTVCIISGLTTARAKFLQSVYIVI